MMVKTAIGLLTLALPQLSLASMFPPNDLYKEDKFESRGGISEKDMSDVSSQIEKQYGPFAAQFNTRLQINKLWSDSEVNASAGRDRDGVWQVNLYGGLARRKEITKDAFTLVACHEAGHLVGGYPFYRGEDLSTEGQADYFATHNCARALWKDEVEVNKTSQTTVNLYAKNQCDASWETDADKLLCYRIANASEALGKLLAKLSGDTVSFETPDHRKVTRTIDTDYPSSQCRLDTYLTAALCKNSPVSITIPGFIAAGNVLSGIEGEAAAIIESCSQFKKELGFRPNCWFAPLDKDGQVTGRAE